MTAPAEHRRPFAFDTEFDADGAVVRPGAWTPAKRAYLPAEAVSYTHLTLPTKA